MKKNSLLVCLLFFCLAGANANTVAYKAEVPAIIGRWDITIDMAGKKQPSWLEVHHSGYKTLVGEFVSTGGSARPISKVNFSDGKVNFSIPPQWEQGDGELSMDATLQNDALSGTISFPDGKSYSFTGVRAPSLRERHLPFGANPLNCSTEKI